MNSVSTVSAADDRMPRMVRIAVGVMGLALAIGAVSTAIRLFRTDPGQSEVLTYLITAAIFALMALLVYKISRGRNWARIAYAVLMFLGLFTTAPAVISEVGRAPSAGALSALLVAAQIVAIALLFVGASNSWFRRE